MAIGRIQLRRGTAAHWVQINPVLADGEPGIEKDTGKQKFGDGVRAWTKLPYASVGPAGQQGPAGPDVNAQLARTPEALIVGAILRDVNGAPTSAAVVWPDGTEGVYTGTPADNFPGAVDAYTITYGAARSYAQPPVTRDSAGIITNQPAIEETTA